MKHERCSSPISKAFSSESRFSMVLGALGVVGV